MDTWGDEWTGGQVHGWRTNGNFLVTVDYFLRINWINFIFSSRL
jgi:hypothetical protein